MKLNQNQMGRIRRGFTQNPFSLFLLCLMVIAWAGCKPDAKQAAEVKTDAGKTNAGSAQATDDRQVAGSYTLVSVDGKKVPCTLQHEGQSPTIKSGVFVLNSDGTCSSKIEFSLPNGKDASQEVKATFTREGQKLTMKWQGAGMNTGSVEGDTFTMLNEGMTFVYSIAKR